MMAKAKILLAEGKVAYVKLAYEAAQDKLSECCELMLVSFLKYFTNF